MTESLVVANIVCALICAKWALEVVANIVCALICAKWALDLGFSQVRQILFLIAGVLFGPLALLILYVYLVKKAGNEGLPGAKIV
jgi:hypothetical protein